MKEQLQEKLVEIVTQIQGAVVKASDFALDQIPDVAHQFIKFKTVWYIAELAMFVALFCCCVYTFNYFKRKYVELNNEGYAFGVIFSCVVGASAVFTFVHNIYQLCMIYFAPKIWLIQQLAEMMKVGK